MTEAFWKQTLSACAHHPIVILLVAAPVAAQRAWIVMRSRPIPTPWLPTIEAFIVLWRLVMCLVAAWVVLTPAQLASVSLTLKSSASVQRNLDLLGEKLGRQLWLLSWEIVFCVAVFFLLNWLLAVAAGLWVRRFDMDIEHKKHQRTALSAVARNLVLVPLALIYVAVVVTHVLTRT